MITSLQNPKVKEVVLLQEKAREREKTGLFPVEGLREVSACIYSGFEIDSLFLCDDILNGVSFPSGIAEEKIFHVSPKVYSKIAYRSSTEGILALVKARHTTLEDLHNLISPETSAPKVRQPLIIVAEAVEKPVGF